MSIPLWLQCTIFWCTSSRIMHHVTKLKSSQTGFLNITMSSLYSNGLQSPDLNPIEQLWDVVEREIHINCVMRSCQYGPKSLRNFSNTLLNLCHELWGTPDPTIQMSWRTLSKHPGLHYTWAVPQTDRLHATPHWCSHSWERSPTKYWVHRDEHTFQKPDISI